ncbi:hypothetical protein [Micrococcus cohnii]|uniref:Uncharacterized protein n=1 Tax=Micrococcus cohnii TaxID=993416 RepID=A0A7W7GPZ3_9MICC|nr:hypothetical protein [Micrococcus cohnii]MBB4736154.1 hypothetical protein [Micrococcus cohnii]
MDRDEPAPRRPETPPRQWKRPGPVTWLWLAAIGLGVASGTVLVVGDRIVSEQPDLAETTLVWLSAIGVLFASQFAVVAAMAATIVCLIRRGLRAVGLVGLLGFVLVFVSVNTGFASDAPEAVVVAALGCFVAATVLCFRAERSGR